jgi:hypothetical protein
MRVVLVVDPIRDDSGFLRRVATATDADRRRFVERVERRIGTLVR